jgi:hypothetical protein
VNDLLKLINFINCRFYVGRLYLLNEETVCFTRHLEADLEKNESKNIEKMFNEGIGIFEKWSDAIKIIAEDNLTYVNWLKDYEKKIDTE